MANNNLWNLYVKLHQFYYRQLTRETILKIYSNVIRHINCPEFIKNKKKYIIMLKKDHKKTAIDIYTIIFIEYKC